MEQNLFTASNLFGNAAWTKNTGVTCTSATADVTDPLGTTTANKIVYDGTGGAGVGRVYRTLAIAGGGPRSAGMWLRTLSGTVSLRFYGGSTYSEPFTVTTTWQFFAFTNTAVAGVGYYFELASPTATNTTFTVYAWRAQAEQSTACGEYVEAVATVVDRGAPANRRVPQNIAFQSQAIGTSPWVTRNTTLTQGQADPWGGTTATLLTASGAGAIEHGMNMVTTPAIVGWITASAYVLYTGTQWVQLGARSGAAWRLANFDILNGVVGTKTASTNSKITRVGTTSWFRIEASWLAGGSGNGGSDLTISAEPIERILDNGFTQSGESVRVAGCQINLGTEADDYASTAAAVVNVISPGRQRQPQNQIFPSEDFANASWIKQAGAVVSAGIVGPAGAGAPALASSELIDLTACATTDGIYRSISTLVGKPMIASVYVRAFSGTARIRLVEPATEYEVDDTKWHRINHPTTSVTGNLALTKPATGTAKFYAVGVQMEASPAGAPGDYVKTVAAVIAPAAYGRRRAAQNLWVESQTFDTGNWTKNSGAAVAANAVAAPDGTMTADALTAGTGNVATSINQVHTIPVASKPPVVGGKYTSSVWLRADAACSVYLETYFSSGTPTSGASLVALTTEWKRFSVTVGVSTAMTNVVFLIGGNGAFPIARTVYVWGAELIQGDTPNDYIATVLLSANPGALARKRLGQNLVQQSEGHTTVAKWGTGDTTVVTGFADPLGGVAATRITEAVTTNFHGLFANGSNAGPHPGGGRVYTSSTFFHGRTRRYAAIYTGFIAPGSQWAEATFDLEAGTVGYSSNCIASMRPVVGQPGWYRCWITYTVTLPEFSYPCDPYLANTSGITVSYLGDITKHIDIFGSQLEQSDMPGDYVKTLDAAVNPTLAPRRYR